MMHTFTPKAFTSRRRESENAVNANLLLEYALVWRGSQRANEGSKGGGGLTHHQPTKHPRLAFTVAAVTQRQWSPVARPGTQQ
jgi:hypothetical protein